MQQRTGNSAEDLARTGLPHLSDGKDVSSFDPLVQPRAQLAAFDADGDFFRIDLRINYGADQSKIRLDQADNSSRNVFPVVGFGPPDHGAGNAGHGIVLGGLDAVRFIHEVHQNELYFQIFFTLPAFQCRLQAPGFDLA